MDAYRLNKGKAELHYIPFKVLMKVAEIFSFGAEKYLPFNYKTKKALPDVSFINSALRHIGAYNDGEDLDPESKLHHIDHAIVNLLMLRDVQLIGKGRDYRFRE